MRKLGGKAAWEDAPEKREASLRERKAKMVLAARQFVFLPFFLFFFFGCDQLLLIVFVRRLLAEQKKGPTVVGAGETLS